ncbi:MAG: PASTA domain-containing protein [Alphaproteobacteria bacterium]|uniref:PASTA domain-containing protein n=1 Tax=Candidatus Nitrobium versatile TaxID=2884831 RepID=A0A953J7K8_9BACT|nr:PASTA domain-containing protein [Candidatus Nitrobium versatile]
MKSLLKIPLYIVILFALGILSGHLTFKVLSFSRTVTVPDLRGKGMVEADGIVRGKGLYIRLEGEDYDSHTRQGAIIRQDILPGGMVKEGRVIGVVLSKGPRVQFVPDIVGQDLDRAEFLLREKGIKVGKILYVHSDQAPRNMVLAQRPEAAEGGSDIFSIIVSLGEYEDEARGNP